MMNLARDENIFKIVLRFIIFVVLSVALMQQAIAVGEQAKITTAEEKKALEIIMQAVKTKNYDVLKSYVVQEDGVYWADCYAEASDLFEKLSFMDVKKSFHANSKNANIRVVEKFAKENHLFEIRTEGWTGEEPFVNFIFAKRDGKLIWQGFCTSYKPDPNALHGKPPRLPRSGVRVFKNIYAFHARIGEILRLGAYDALRSYAVRPSLSFADCSEGGGKEVAINEVINFLKKNNEKKGELKYFNLRSSLETEGWTGDYPHVSFRFTENRGRWEWTGLSRCKSRPGEHAKKGKIYYERY